MLHKFAAPLLLSLALLSQTAAALPAPMHLAPGKISPPLQSGELIGGQSGTAFSLLGVKSTPAGRGDKLSFAYGDREGKAIKGEPGYFHILIDHDAKRVVIDLAQVSKTTLEATAIQRTLETSHLVASSDVTMDPADGSTNITLVMRAPVKVRASTESAQVVLDLEPAH